MIRRMSAKTCAAAFALGALSVTAVATRRFVRSKPVRRSKGIPRCRGTRGAELSGAAAEGAAVTALAI